MADIAELIHADHEWFREQFARLDDLQARAPVSGAALERVWCPLADKLDVHAYIEEKNLLSATAAAWRRSPGGRDAGCDR